MESGQNEVSDDVAGRASITSRRIAAPRARVFRAFTDPARLALWWGPRGFSNTFHEFDLRPGGYWRFIMHGPDGTDYPNESVFVEVTAPERVVLRHLNGHHFVLTICFTECEGGTEVGWCQAFDTPEHWRRIADFVAHANEENLDRLAEVVAAMAD
ncbi:MAG: SRPBCC family protein [Proteobacteria bacterium]|nr:SRPBCC family protein [Pseudomonadota bacterium]HQR04561.1 SRPBCC family protein [Rhodocyclaceae bacterium]